MITKDIILPFIISNLFAVFFLVLATEKPTTSRLILSILFTWAGLTNLYVCQNTPEVYIKYAESASDIYVNFINGWFSKNIKTFVSLIAVGQLIIAAGLWLKGKWANLGTIGSIIFFIAISPLGLYAALPFPVIMSIGTLFILGEKDKKSLFRHFIDYRRQIKDIQNFKGSKSAGQRNKDIYHGTN